MSTRKTKLGKSHNKVQMIRDECVTTHAQRSEGFGQKIFRLSGRSFAGKEEREEFRLSDDPSLMCASSNRLSTR
jgi:hypothetical protein